MNATLTDDKSSMDKQSETSIHDESGKFMAFIAGLLVNLIMTVRRLQKQIKVSILRKTLKMKKMFVRLIINYLRNALRLRR